MLSKEVALAFDKQLYFHNKEVCKLPIS